MIRKLNANIVCCLSSYQVPNFSGQARAFFFNIWPPCGYIQTFLFCPLVVIANFCLMLTAIQPCMLSAENVSNNGDNDDDYGYMLLLIMLLQIIVLAVMYEYSASKNDTNSFFRLIYNDNTFDFLVYRLWRALHGASLSMLISVH